MKNPVSSHPRTLIGSSVYNPFSEGESTAAGPEPGGPATPKQWEISFHFDGRFFQATKLVGKETGKTPQQLYIWMDGERIARIGRNRSRKIKFHGKTGEHVLKAFNGKESRSLLINLNALFKNPSKNGVGLSIDGIPVHHTIFDPHWHVRLGMKWMNLLFAIIPGTMLLAHNFAQPIQPVEAWELATLAPLGLARWIFARQHATALSLAMVATGFALALSVLDLGGKLVAFGDGLYFGWMALLAAQVTGLAMLRQAKRATEGTKLIIKT